MAEFLFIRDADNVVIGDATVDLGVSAGTGITRRELVSTLKFDPATHTGGVATVATSGTDNGKVTAIAAQRTQDVLRADWFSRIGQSYQISMDLRKEWWPTQYSVLDTGSTTTNLDARNRAFFVVNYEIPNWLWDIAVILSAAVRGVVWSTMTNDEIEACVAWQEALIAGPITDGSGNVVAPNIVKRWYDVGLSQSGTTAAVGTTLTGTGYANRQATPYTDMFEVVSNKLVTHVPDYSWGAVSVIGTPTNFDPENPS